MKASVVDLRYKMNDVLKALDRNEKITILYHGKVKGIISPVLNKKNRKVSEHRFFGMYEKSKKSVEQELEDLRGNRYNDI
ncbi:MAG: type II toxin-antitoxin system Phd/YefM family antitoxin [Candidatus Marinimicrobia bacterium]|nr:type II toxin-antitoxin system Phd/YefM family antitoxin [Candidatus Neomarinimicrobiota bacterium]